MKGLFGNILGIINVIGGYSLTLLMGKKIVFTDSLFARWVRFVCGTYLISTAIGITIGLNRSL